MISLVFLISPATFLLGFILNRHIITVYFLGHDVTFQCLVYDDQIGVTSNICHFLVAKHLNPFPWYFEQRTHCRWPWSPAAAGRQATLLSEGTCCPFSPHPALPPLTVSPPTPCYELSPSTTHIAGGGPGCARAGGCSTTLCPGVLGQRPAACVPPTSSPTLLALVIRHVPSPADPGKCG